MDRELVEKCLTERTSSGAVVDADEYGLVVRFRDPLLKGLMRDPGVFFNGFLQPIANALAECFRELCEALTDMDFDAIDSCFAEIESPQGISKDSLGRIGKLPRMRSEKEARSFFADHNLPSALLDYLYPL